MGDLLQVVLGVIGSVVAGRFLLADLGRRHRDMGCAAEAGWLAGHIGLLVGAIGILLQGLGGLTK